MPAEFVITRTRQPNGRIEVTIAGTGVGADDIAGPIVIPKSGDVLRLDGRRISGTSTTVLPFLSSDEEGDRVLAKPEGDAAATKSAAGPVAYSAPDGVAYYWFSPAEGADNVCYGEFIIEPE